MTVECEICGEELKDTRGLFGHKRLKHPEVAGSEEGKPATKAVMTRPQPLDAVIQDLVLPAVPAEYNGSYHIYVEGFNAGVMHGAKSILAGIRAAQELSSIGIQQATPVIKMAQEMRQAEGQAAQLVAAQLSQATMQGNQQIIEAIHGLAASPEQPTQANPMMQMMSQAMQPLFFQVMQQMAATMPKVPQRGTPQGGSQPPGDTGTTGAGQGDLSGELPGNITSHSLSELEEQDV